MKKTDAKVEIPENSPPESEDFSLVGGADFGYYNDTERRYSLKNEKEK